MTAYIYVGTYTKDAPHGQGRADGIYVLRLDRSSGALTLSDVAGGITNPSFLALDPSRRFLYAVNETPEIDGEHSGAVSAFAIDQETGSLTYLNRQPSKGIGPCYVSVESSGRFALVANYGSGSVAMLPIGDDGRLAPPSDFHQHSGSSVNPERQAGPHAHAIVPDPSNRYALAADLGIDQVLVYRLDLDAGALRPNAPPATALAPGAGPRHLAFHPSAAYVYVINELDSTVTACAWDAAGGTLRPFQTLSTLPEGFSGTNYCADVHVAPSGRFVYGSNRGHDSIAIFAVDESDGSLSPAGHVPTQGQWPRNFAIDPAGEFLFAANQNSDTIVTFRVEGGTGQLSRTGHVLSLPSPVCLRIMDGR